MSYVSQADLVTDFKLKSGVQVSEGYTDPGDYEVFIQDAVRNHNSSYVLTASTSTVPDREKEPIVLLAWRALCLARASRFSTQASIQGAAGIGTDRNTPYYKSIDLAKLLFERYKQVVSALELSIAAYGVRISEVTVADLDTGARVPIANAQLPAAPVITGDAQVDSSGELVLAWTVIDIDEDFDRFIIFYDQSATPIRQEWNFNSTSGFAQVRNGLTAEFETYNPRLRSVKMTGLVLTGDNHRVLILHKNKAGLINYSNEHVATNI